MIIRVEKKQPLVAEMREIVVFETIISGVSIINYIKIFNPHFK